MSRRSCEDGPLLEDQETEGQRQLHSLLLQQLHTNVDFDRSENILFIFSICSVNVKQVQQYVENNEGKKKKNTNNSTLCSEDVSPRGRALPQQRSIGPLESRQQV